MVLPLCPRIGDEVMVERYSLKVFRVVLEEAVWPRVYVR